MEFKVFTQILHAINMVNGFQQSPNHRTKILLVVYVYIGSSFQKIDPYMSERAYGNGVTKQ